jgi:hypothetical protein
MLDSVSSMTVFHVTDAERWTMVKDKDVDEQVGHVGVELLAYLPLLVYRLRERVEQSMDVVEGLISINSTESDRDRRDRYPGVGSARWVG